MMTLQTSTKKKYSEYMQSYFKASTSLVTYYKWLVHTTENIKFMYCTNNHFISQHKQFPGNVTCLLLYYTNSLHLLICHHALLISPHEQSSLLSHLTHREQRLLSMWILLLKQKHVHSQHNNLSHHMKGARSLRILTPIFSHSTG